MTSDRSDSWAASVLGSRGWGGVYSADLCGLCYAAVPDPSTDRLGRVLWFGSAALYGGRETPERAYATADGRDMYGLVEAARIQSGGWPTFFNLPWTDGGSFATRSSGPAPLPPGPPRRCSSPATRPGASCGPRAPVGTRSRSAGGSAGGRSRPAGTSRRSWPATRARGGAERGWTRRDGAGHTIFSSWSPRGNDSRERGTKIRRPFVVPTRRCP